MKADQEALVTRELARVNRLASSTGSLRYDAPVPGSQYRGEGVTTTDAYQGHTVDKEAAKRTEHFIENQGGGSYYDGLMARSSKAAPKDKKAPTQAPSGLNRKERRALASGEIAPVGAPPEIQPVAPPPQVSSAQVLPMPGSAVQTKSGESISVEEFMRMKAEAAAKAKSELQKRKLSEREQLHEKKTAEATASAFGEAGFHTGGWTQAKKVEEESDSESEDKVKVKKKQQVHEITHTLETEDTSMQHITSKVLEAQKAAAATAEAHDQVSDEDRVGTVEADVPVVTFKKKRKVAEVVPDEDPPVSTSESKAITVTNVTASGKRRNFRRKVEDN
eukprot:TRINITY_DN10008_c0_g1_i1.p1 TRINITY_DN10008_c0_g1~~TRINITY_DN10008_c0_g1_i1.p1  ORF type:complete len:389 (+),score=170.00 TRINITY_DN10008_c0_g1_i1:166-1167(+)